MNANAAEVGRDEDAKAIPLRHPEFYRYNGKMPEAQAWRRKPEAA
jgi:hypothetical protein